VSSLPPPTSHLSFALSDISYVLPGTDAQSPSHLGSSAAQWAARGGLNAFGERGEAKILETRPHVGGVLAGSLAAGLLATAYGPSSTTVPALGGALATLARSRLPAVVHLVARGVGGAGADVPTSTDFESLSDLAAATGAPVLVSASLQEAHDLAVVAHAAAVLASSPVVHAFDGGAAGADVSGTARLLRPYELARALDAQRLAAHRARGNGTQAASTASVSPTEALVAACAATAPLLGRPYALAEYTGHPKATAVLVAVGAGAAAAAAYAAQAAEARGETIGVVRIRALLPDAAAAARLVAAALPPTVTRVASLTFLPSWEAHAAAGNASALAGLVRAAVASSKTAASATVLDWAAATDGFVEPRHVASVFARLTVGAPPSRLVVGREADDGEAGANGNPLSLVFPAAAANAGSRVVRVWGLAHDGAAAVARASAGLLAAASAAPGCTALLSSTVEGRFAYGAVTATTVSVQQQPQQQQQRQPVDDEEEGTGTASVAPPTDDAVGAILVTHLSLPAAYDVFAPLARGGVVVLNATPAGPPPKQQGDADGAAAAPAATTTKSSPFEETVAALAPADRALLAQRGARVAVVPAAALAAAHGLEGRADLVLQSALLLAVAGPAGFARAAGALESHHRALLPSSAHSGLVKMYAALRKTVAVTEAPAEWAKEAGAGSSAAARRPLAPAPTLPVRPLATAPTTAGAPGVGPADWATLRTVATSAHASSSSFSSNAAYLGAQAKSAALTLAFPEAFHTARGPAPSGDGGGHGAAASAEGAHASSSSSGLYTASVRANVRLTPLEYDRNVFHIEFDIAGSGLSYAIGSALGVHGHNDEAEVDAVLGALGLDGDAIVALPPADGAALTGPGATTAVTTLRRALIQDLDLFGKPGKDFYEGLAPHAAAATDRAALALLGSDAGADEFAARAAESVTFADALADFPSARPPVAALLALLPRIKPRHYSIASSMRAHPTSVHLLVVEVGWTSPSGRARRGQCSSYMARLPVGAKVTVSVLPSEMHLPLDPAAPVLMAGLGTGMAPFRAFIQERAYLRDVEKRAVGPMVLYMGSRFRAMEFLYGDELEEYERQGLLTLRLAFSRDGPRKVYIQHLMEEDETLLSSLLLKGKGSFYLCGPTWPEPDVEAAITAAFAKAGGLGVEGAGAMIRSMKEAKRYVLEVY
jgi:sulfite reductase alpha subunit-like flavoprotein